MFLFNAGLGYVQEGRAQTLDALKSRLALTCSVRRDGAWTTLPSTQFVAAGLVTLSLGVIVPADVTITTGSVLKTVPVSRCSVA